ncbi:MAG: DUF2007 domain-containing protein [Bacteroidales bacterium]|nr:DUF2007 domain-containing protein [Bacteroidales bacterium]
MNTNWVKIFSSAQLYNVEIIKGILAENKITAVTVNKKDSSYLFGEVELYVHYDNVLKAKQIINSHNKK